MTIRGGFPMRMNWYYRMMLSYTPIFFVAISSLILIFFTMLNRSSENRYMETNKAIVRQLMESTDATLKLIERNVVSELYTDKLLQTFFNDEPKSLFDYYTIQKKLIDVKSTLPFASSIYLYNAATDKVLTESGVFLLPSFGDKVFFADAYERRVSAGWTDPRPYSLSADDPNKQQVVSLIKVYPYAADKQGAVVINVYLSSIVAYLNQFHPKTTESVQLLGSFFHPPDTSGLDMYVRSEYTGWYYRADIIHAEEYSVLSMLSNIWFIIVLAIIVLALVLFTLITHVHYKPIQAILAKMEGYMARKSEQLGLKTHANEFKFIETAIDDLLRKSVDYENLHKEGERLRRQTLFLELLEGFRTLTEPEWEKQMRSFGLPHTYKQLGVVVLEIDRYRSFTEKYKPADQNLLKFLLETAFRELVQQRGLSMWHAWVEPRQMAAVLHLHESGTSGQETLRQACEEFQKWLAGNLELTVSAGIGEAVDSIEDIASAFRNAKENVSFKAAFGTGSIIDNRTIGARTNGESYRCYQAIMEIAHYFRSGDEQWKSGLADLMGRLQDMPASRLELAAFLNNLIHRLGKEIGALSPDIKRRWSDRCERRLAQIADETETIAELHESLEAEMAALAEEIEQEQVSRKKHKIAMQIKEYIDRNYADPSLSLVQVGDRYGLKPRSVSSLFKEEIGENFLDYLLKVRFNHAKEMLVHTDEPIQNIAEKVGYTHVISFHRAFKKMYDLPPGEYRNVYRLRLLE